LRDIVFDLPFSQLEKAIPFEIEQDEVDLIEEIYKQYLLKINQPIKINYALISSYVIHSIAHS